MKKFTLFLVAMTMSLLSFAQTQMSGEYTVGTGGTYDYASMADAGMAIKSAEFTGDVTLLICTDLTETINTGIVNKSEHTLTIRPDKDENRTITYTTATDNTGPTGVFVIGGDMTKTPGSTIGWASVPTTNVIVDGAAEGKTTPRLKITTGKFGTGFLIYGDVQDCVVKNCILENTGTASANYALTFRSEKYSSTSKNIGPKNCVVENCILEATHASKSQTIYFNGSQANSAAGYPANITIRNCNIKGHTRGMFLYGVNGLNVEGCTFDMSDMASGLMCHGILGNTVKGTINVKGNKFIKNSTKNTYAGEFGLQTITASGGATLWVIENNYFAGYDAVASGTTSKESRLVGIRCGDPCEIRHNTFYMPKLTHAPGSALVGAHPTALLWLAGTHKYPVQNNIFVCEETTANVSLIRGGLNENVTGNVFYHKGGNAAIVAAAPSCMTFADLETSYPTQAATSKWTNVTFADAANGDLSLAGSSDGDLNLAVDRLAEVLTDINGTARREKTYAGAYEGGEFPAEVCTVTTIVEPIGSGTVEGMGDHAKGTSVTLTPVPSTGYEFVDWKFEDATTSTDNPLTLVVNGDITVTANFAKKQYTLTVQANDPTKGSVALDPAGGIYEYETEVTLTATANDGYEFVNWSNGSTVNPLTMTVTGEETITANFRTILASSITLNAYPVKDYTASIVGTMKRAIQNGENTIVLTHEANGTAHIYNIAHATKTITEISQEGVVAVDPDNAGDFLAISDIALTADGKLVACNYMLCQNTASYVDAGYKRGTTRFYIWDNIDSNPTLWFTSQQSVNYYRARIGYTMALKGTSDDAWVIVAGFNNNATGPARFDHYHLLNGSKSTTSPSKAANMSYSAIGSTYEISASPLADGNWVLDGELAVPTEFVESKDNQEMTIFTPIAESVLGKKYNGATYLANYNDHHLMVAPYANGDGKLAGVKVLGISDGFAAATLVTTATDLTTPIDATSAAATAYVDGDGDLTIYLIADGKVYTFSEKVLTIHHINAHADHTNKGYVTGAGDYYEGEEVVLKATAKTGYYFTQWKDGNTNNPRTITVTDDAEYIAEFAEAYPRVYAYGLNLVNNGDDTYTFSFKPNTDAISGNLLLYSEDGTTVAKTVAITTPIVANTVNSITLSKTDLPDQSDIPWAIELSGNAIPAFAETFADADYRFARAHAVIDNSPESEYFGRVYVADRRKTKSNSSVYVYNPDFTDFTTTQLGLSTAGYSRPAVGADGTLYLTGYTDGAEAGIFVVDPADLTKCTQFFNGTYDSDGLYKNNGKEIGSSTSGVGVYGAGKDAVLYTMMEDGSNANFNSGKQPIVKYQIGQENGTVLKQWSDEPTWLVNYPATGKDTYNFGNNDFAATAKGVWVSQNKSNPADRPEIAFVDKTGTVQFMQNSKPSLGGGMTVNADNTILYIVEDSKILEYAITWNENTPSLTLSNTYPISLQYISTLSVDYAGNLIACAGTTYGTTDNNVMKVVRFTLPTDNNTTIVPAAKAKSLKLGNRYTVTVVINDDSMGEVIGAGLYKEGETAELAAAPAANHRIVNWKNGEEVLSTDLTCSFEVTENVTINVTFEKIPQYTVTTVASPDGKGTIIGGGTYNEGTEVELKATAHTGYTFVKWDEDGNTEATRTITVTGPVTYTAIFDKVSPRAWAYDLKKGEDGENYTFTFKTTSAGTATLIFKDKDGNIQDFGAHTIDATAAEEKTITIAKSVFDAATKDIYWEVELAGGAITKMAEITDPALKIYDFYSTLGVVVDNNPESEYFGKIYVQATLNGASDGKTLRAQKQKAGLFIYDQKLDELNPTTNDGIQPSLPSGYSIGDAYQFNRLAIDPTTNNITYCYAVKNQPAVFSMDRANLTGTPSNLLAGQTGITRSVAHCFDQEGNLYVMDLPGSGQIFKIEKNGTKSAFGESTDKYVQVNTSLASDGRGGLWVSQNRGQIDTYYQLVHYNASGTVDFAVYQGNENGFTGGSYRGALAYDIERQILAQGRDGAVELFNVVYDAETSVPTLTKFATTPTLSGANIDGLAFDYAGDLYMVNSGTERFYKYVLPTDNNTCTVPAPESQVIQKERRYTVTVVANPAEGGTVSVSDGGNAVEGATLEVTATASTGYRFVNWTEGTEVVSTEASFEYTVPAKDVTLTANFEPLPEITYELNGGVWNKYGWTSKKDMYNALLDDWRAYSGSTRTNVTYETQLGIGNSSKGIPTTITSVDDRVAFWNLFADATYAPKWGWLATYVDAVAATQYKKMDVAQGVKTQPTSAAGVFTFTIGNFFGEDNAHSTDYIDAVDFTGEEAHITAFAPYWGQTFPMPTQPTEEVVLNAPYKEGCEFGGWFVTSDFSGAAVTTVDENTDGTLYAKWIETVITVTIGEDVDNTTNLAPYVDKTVTATVTRNFGADKILTVTLPFDMSASQISYHFGNATVYEFYNVVDAGEELHLQFSRTTSIEAGKPYIIQTAASGYEAENGFTIENVTINTDLTHVEIGGITMVPVLDGGGTLDKETQYYLSNNALYCAGEHNQPLPGLRAFFTSATSTPIRARVIFDDNEATSIPTVIAPKTKAQKIIQDGRLIIIRGEHQYNAQGQMIE